MEIVNNYKSEEEDEVLEKTCDIIHTVIMTSLNIIPQHLKWSIHFNCSADQKLFCGDGGDPGQVAKAPDGRWIYLFTPKDNTLISKKLVNMKNHNNKLEPNVHFSPDGKWIIFRANFEKIENVYAVEIKETAL